MLQTERVRTKRYVPAKAPPRVIDVSWTTIFLITAGFAAVGIIAAVAR